MLKYMIVHFFWIPYTTYFRIYRYRRYKEDVSVVTSRSDVLLQGESCLKPSWKTLQDSWCYWRYFGPKESCAVCENVTRM